MSFNGTKNKRPRPPAYHRQDIINLSGEARVLLSLQTALQRVRQITDLSRALDGAVMRLAFNFCFFLQGHGPLTRSHSAPGGEGGQGDRDEDPAPLVLQLT